MTLRRSRPHSSKRWLGSITAIGALLLVGVTLVAATLAPSGFDAQDGNLTFENAGGPDLETKDWATVGIDCESTPKVGCAIDLATGQGDNSFGQGTKEDTAVPSVVSGSIPNNKSDLVRFYVANENVGGSAEFLYLAWERVQEPTGTTNMDFEFNQSETLSANGVTPVRTAGDVLIKFDLAQGGVNPMLGYHRWVTSGSCEANGQQPPCWDPVHPLAGNFEGSVNSVEINDPIPPCDEADDPNCNTLSARTFGEASINLTASGIFPEGSCTEFGSAYLKSRSSDSFTAALKDFIAPISVDIANCGSITIIKDAIPNSVQDFGYTTTGTGLSSFTLEDDGNESNEPATPGAGGDWPNSITFSDVFAGTYTVTETLPVTNWSLTNISCTDPDGGNSSGDVGTATATINVAVSETVVCTFTNKKDATVTVTKDAIPNALTDFPYAGGGTGPTGWSSFSLDDDAGVTGGDGTLSSSASFTFSGTQFGQKTVTETVPSGWSLTNLVCTESVSIAGAVATISVDPGDTITCDYENKKDATVTIIKDAIPNSAQDFGYTTTGAGLSSFTLEDDGNESNEPATPGTGGDWPNSKSFTISGANFGQKTITETLPVSNWSLTNLTCNESVSIVGAVATISVDPGDAITCTYENKKDATVTIIKDADPNALTDFVFAVTGTGPASWVNFSLDDDSGVTGATTALPNSQMFTFSGNSQFGEKTVTETPIPSGWDLGLIACSGDDNYEIGTDDDADFTAGDAKVTLDVDPGEAITCTFTNDSLHVVIVLVCHQGTGTLVASEVTLDPEGSLEQTLTSLSSAPTGLTDAQLCGLLGARFTGLEHGDVDLTADVGSGHLP